MNRLFCFLSGGHRYADTNLTASRPIIHGFVIIRNECIKCGKAYTSAINVDAIIREDLAKMKGGAE